MDLSVSKWKRRGKGRQTVKVGGGGGGGGGGGRGMQTCHASSLVIYYLSWQGWIPWDCHWVGKDKYVEIYSPATSHAAWPWFSLSFFSSESCRGGVQLGGRQRVIERQKEKRDAWMNTSFVHLSHVDLIRSCLLVEMSTDSRCQPWRLCAAFRSLQLCDHI